MESVKEYDCKRFELWSAETMAPSDSLRASQAVELALSLEGWVESWSAVIQHAGIHLHTYLSHWAPPIPRSGDLALDIQLLVNSAGFQLPAFSALGEK